ncbi:DUF5709 domain-containing protein [Rhizomonospora bruguierae]|uniref:DUF5709 domain-containing protein n=1 Tax=Rhizomonospora bruguierae TaxID=1581705 RepID=UPI001BCB628F|nr:DUF5709 domain-containing protein [Micromonospora sp. NBRC 107566]
MRRPDEIETTKDIESDGIPPYADEDTDAYDDLGQRGLEDGPPAVPGGAPDAVDRFGTTAEEQRVGEDLDAKLAQEEPDVEVGSPAGDPSRRLTDEATAERATEESTRDADVLDDGPPLASNPGSPVSLYDRPDVPGGADPAVGRLVQPDSGFGEDTDKEEIALDSGERTGELPEERAMHQIGEDDL